MAVMPTITAIKPQARQANRLSVYLDGRYALGLNRRVAERFGLRVGMELCPDLHARLMEGECAQKCFDKAMAFIARRMHSRSELRRKLTRAEFSEAIVDATMEKLSALKYVDDAEFARQKLVQSHRKLIGQRRAMQELRQRGVDPSTARKAIDEHFDRDEAQDNARLLIEKHLPRLRRLDPLVARRRLAGLMQRRGFDYESVKPLIDLALGEFSEDDAQS